MYKNIIITGDFDINTAVSSFESDHFSSLLKEHSLFRVPFGFTHFTSNFSSIIDYILTDFQCKVIDFLISDTPIASGHHSLFIKYKFVLKLPSRTICFRDKKNCDFELANNTFKHLNEHIVQMTSTVSAPTVIVNTLINNISSTFNDLAP